MYERIKYYSQKTTQILIPNQLEEVGTYFAFYLCNLLIITIFTFVKFGLIQHQLSFLFFFKNQFKASEF